MSTQTITRPIAPPFLPALRTRLARAGRSIWRALEAHGRRRSRRELLAVADRWQSRDPELAAQVRAAALDRAPV